LSDFADAFHQIPLDLFTSRLLAMATPRGLLEPIFAPKGAVPMSATLQKIAQTIFGDNSDLCIYIFDNLLILCSDYQDAFTKLKLIIRRAVKYNLIFKMAKTFLGYSTVKFFGYEISNGSYRISDERKEGIAKWVFPTNTEGFQRFLGVALYLKLS
jgi:hypothetical protein